MTTFALDAARDLRRLIDDNARKGAGAPLAIESVRAMQEAGLFTVGVPAAVGGTELPLTDCIDVWSEVSRADGSAGWCLMASCATAAYFAAWCPDELVDQMFADGVPIAAGQFAPNGTARVTADGYVLNGRYQFGSGTNHADWIGAGVLTEVAEGADPDYLFAIFPASRARLTGNWDVLGLQSTASFDYLVEEVEVPAAATFDFFRLERHRGGPTFDLGVMILTAAGHAAFALGVVRRALDEVRVLAKHHQRMGQGVLGDNERVQYELGVLESRAAAAAAWVHEAFSIAEHNITERVELDPLDSVRCRQATVFATQDGAEVIQRAYLLAGTTALRDGALQRCFRDIHAGTQHMFAGPTHTTEYGRDLIASAPADPLDC